MIKSILHDIREKREGTRLTREIRRLDGELSANSVTDFLFSERARLITPWQIKDEFLRLARIVETRKPRALLEIGTADGGTLFAHARLAAKDALLVSIDLPGGEFGGGYDSWRIPLYEAFAGPDQDLELLREDSHSDRTRQRLESVLDGRRFEYIFIDGDHSYEGVRQDVELALCLAAPHAIIALHDIVKHPDESCNVHDVWQELKLQHPHEELVQDPAQQWAGIGILYLD